MTTNVSIKNAAGHQPVTIHRRQQAPEGFIGNHPETFLGAVQPGEEINHVAVWEGNELVIREVQPDERPAA